MKSNKGVAMTSLIIYILGLVIVAGIIGSFSTYFYNRANLMVEKNTSEEQYSKVLSYLTKDINSNNITSVSQAGEEGDFLIIEFADGTEHQYINKNGCIYYIKVGNSDNKKIALCKDVKNKEKVFEYEDETIKINLLINDRSFSNTFKVDI